MIKSLANSPGYLVTHLRYSEIGCGRRAPVWREEGQKQPRLSREKKERMKLLED